MNTNECIKVRLLGNWIYSGYAGKVRLLGSWAWGSVNGEFTKLLLPQKGSWKTPSHAPEEPTVCPCLFETYLKAPFGSNTTFSPYLQAKVTLCIFHTAWKHCSFSSFPYLAYICCVTFCKYHSETTYITQSASLTCGIWHSSFQLAAAFTFSNFIVNHTKLWENSWSFCHLRKQVIWESFKNKRHTCKPKMGLKSDLNANCCCCACYPV